MSKGGIVLNQVAKWNGSAWSALGSGVSGGNVAAMNQSCVFALAIDGANTLYAGGEFLNAGGKVSPYIAKCKLNGSDIRPREIVASFPHLPAHDARSGLIRIHLQSPTNVIYRIFTLTGREVLRGSEMVPKGDTSLRLKTAKLANGSFIVQVYAGKQSIRFRMTKER
jgi:hypothetical protein